MEPQGFYKTRLAPTPSGFLHLGNLYSFVLTTSLAKKHGTNVLLRVDDMDRGRVRHEYIDDIFESLAYLGISWDRGPKNTSELDSVFSQHKRLPLYKKALQSLAEAGKLFACDCTRNEVQTNSSERIYPGTCRHKNIPLDQADVSWRLNTSESFPLKMKQYGKESAAFELPETMKDFIVRKKDGDPSYQVCSLLDDVLFEIDLVVRGQDLWESSLAQLYLAKVLGLESFSQAGFFHHPLLMGSGGEKLSKSAGNTSVFALRQEGKSREQIYTLLSSYGVSVESIKDLLL